MAKRDTKPKTKKEPEPGENPECFVIMPISDPDSYEPGHFRKVYEDIFKVACDRAGFKAIRADDIIETNLIHLDMLKRLIDSPMAICDLSSRNPNVLFELGIRQAFDKPTVLIQEVGTPKIFDIGPLRYTEYRRELKYREVIDDQKSVAEAILATQKSTDEKRGINSIIRLLALDNPASLEGLSNADAAIVERMQLLMASVEGIRNDINDKFKRIDRTGNQISLFSKTSGSYLGDKEDTTDMEFILFSGQLGNNKLSSSEAASCANRLIRSFNNIGLNGTREEAIFAAQRIEEINRLLMDYNPTEINKKMNIKFQ